MVVYILMCEVGPEYDTGTQIIHVYDSFDKANKEKNLRENSSHYDPEWMNYYIIKEVVL